MSSSQATFKWTDEDGDETRSIVHIKSTDGTIDDTQFVALQDAMQAGSAAALYNRSLNVDAAVSATPADGPYSVADKAIMLFRTGVGTLVKLAIPAPLAALLEDDDFIQAGNELADAIIAAAYATLTDKSGNVVTTFLRGWRDRRNRKT